MPPDSKPRDLVEQTFNVTQIDLDSEAEIVGAIIVHAKDVYDNGESESFTYRINRTSIARLSKAGCETAVKLDHVAHCQDLLRAITKNRGTRGYINVRVEKP